MRHQYASDKQFVGPYPPYKCALISFGGHYLRTVAYIAYKVETLLWCSLCILRGIVKCVNRKVGRAIVHAVKVPVFIVVVYDQYIRETLWSRTQLVCLNCRELCGTELLWSRRSYNISIVIISITCTRFYVLRLLVQVSILPYSYHVLQFNDDCATI